MSEELRSTLDRLALELRQLNQRLQAETSHQSESLNDFREAVDSVRLTAWTVYELSRARKAGEDDPSAVLVLTANERARRFRQMAVNLCSDLDSGFLRRELARDALSNRIDALKKRLDRVDDSNSAA